MNSCSLPSQSRAASSSLALTRPSPASPPANDWRSRDRTSARWQLGGRVEHPGDDQRLREVAPPLRRSAGQKRFEIDAARRPERRQNMAVRQGANDLDGLRRRQQALTLQHNA
ncbi:MAG: hypothetical protein JOY71_24310 [Acetobacteraceae bacterium]|nr:hypothetical protein [Acetobacteraceae bacterium]